MKILLGIWKNWFQLPEDDYSGRKFILINIVAYFYLWAMLSVFRLLFIWQMRDYISAHTPAKDIY